MGPTPACRDTVAIAFRSRFGGEPAVLVRAPGRVDLMGRHTDYNLGCVLTMAIGLETWIAARPRPDRVVSVYSANMEDEATFGLDRLSRQGLRPWGRYVAGVASIFQTEGMPLQGFDGVVASTLPLGSGLSSSAALECATATTFEVLGGWKLNPVRKARLCQRAENEFVGVACGILDQYTSVLGQEGCALMLDCRNLSSRPVELPADIQVVACDTRAKRELAVSEYAVRKAQCEQGARVMGVTALREATLPLLEAHATRMPAVVARRCRFVIEEQERVLRLADTLPRGDRASLRRLTEDSYEGAGELYEVVAPAMRVMYEAMLSAPGVIGGRQAGAGFGGCMIAFVEREGVGAFTAAVSERYERALGIRPEIHPLQPVSGAGLAA